MKRGSPTSPSTVESPGGPSCAGVCCACDDFICDTWAAIFRGVVMGIDEDLLWNTLKTDHVLAWA